MEIEYATTSIQQYFSDLYDIPNSKNLLQKKIGSILTKNAKKRLDQLTAATTFQKYWNCRLSWRQK